MRTAARLLAAVALLLGIATPAAARPAPLHTFVIQNDTNMPAAWAADQWSANASGVTLRVVDSCAGPDCIRVTAPRDPWGFYAAGWAGYTSSLPDGTALVEIGSDAQQSRDESLRRAVMAHELGHAIGLGHVDPAVDPRSVMHPSYDGVTRPDRRDLLAVRALYS